MTEIEKGIIEKVIFAIDIPIGQKLKYFGKVLTTVEQPEEKGCIGCFFYTKSVPSQLYFQCTKEFREDKKNVIFKEVD